MTLKKQQTLEYQDYSKIISKSCVSISEVDFSYLFNDTLFWNFYGHIISDGHTFSQAGIIGYSNNEIKLIEEVKNEIKKLFKKKCTVKKRNNKLYILILCYTKLSKFIEKIEEKNFLPQKEKHIYSFLRACFDDEGSINKKGYTISIIQKNKQYIDNIYYLLKKLSIKSKKYIIYNKKYKRNYYCLRLLAKDNDGYHKFFFNINFTHPKKSKRLLNYIRIIDKKIGGYCLGKKWVYKWNKDKDLPITKKLIKIGNSLGLTIDKSITEKIGLIKGDLVEFDIKKVKNENILKD